MVRNVDSDDDAANNRGSGEIPGHESQPSEAPLGAAGTSRRGTLAQQAADQPAPQGEGGNGGRQQKKGSIGKKGIQAAAIPAAMAAAQLAIIAMFLKLLQTMLAAAIQLTKTFFAKMMAFIMKGLAWIGNAAIAAGTWVTSVVGGAVATNTLAVSLAGLAATAGTFVAASVAMVEQAAIPQRDGQMSSQCLPQDRAGLQLVSSTATDEQSDEQAELIYSILAGMDMPEENIAAVIGNFGGESDLDPTAVETIFDEPFTIGDQKQAAWDANWDVHSIDSAYAAEYPAINKVGIGFGQWTNGRNDLLMQYAAGADGEWHDAETQIGFMFSDDDPSRVDYMHGMIDESKGSVAEAVNDFKVNWEGLSSGSPESRIQTAEHYMGMFGGWDADEGLADSILEAADSSREIAGSAARNTAIANASDCDSADAILAGLTVDGVGTDDYPYRDPVGVKGFGMARTVFGHTQRECTDFVMWRVNQAMGWSEDSTEPPPFTFANLGVGYSGGQRGAGSWNDILTGVDGIDMVDTPQPGDIAWWGYNDVGGGYGHVGFVAEVNDGEVLIEHYNYSSVSAYSATRHSIDEIPGYIRIGEDVVGG